jgi:phosphoribosylformylglycinamidine synthase
MKIIHYHRKRDVPPSLLSSLQEELKNTSNVRSECVIETMEMEYCFNVQPSQDLSKEQTQRLEWLLAETFDARNLQREQSTLIADAYGVVMEMGPRMAFTSAFSSNAVSICQACDIPIIRLELSRRYRLQFPSSSPPEEPMLKVIRSLLHDRMTEQVYETPLTSFDNDCVSPAPTKTISIMKEGRAALERINDEMGLGFDDFDLDYYTDLFKVCQFCIGLDLVVCVLWEACHSVLRFPSLRSHI